MTDAFTTAATEAARKRLSWHDMQFGDVMRPMVSMAEWARGHLAQQEPTDAEVEAAAREMAGAAALIVAAGPKPWEWWTDRNQARFRKTARAALAAAREARP